MYSLDCLVCGVPLGSREQEQGLCDSCLEEQQWEQQQEQETGFMRTPPRE